jgi:hypothetical protein
VNHQEHTALHLSWQSDLVVGPSTRRSMAVAGTTYRVLMRTAGKASCRMARYSVDALQRRILAASRTV